MAFAPALGGTFLLDDFSLLGDPAFTSASGLAELLHPSRVRPLTNLTFWANFQVHGASPFGFHLVNLLLHLAAVWLASDALRRLLPSNAALLAAAVFALHPLQAEPVAYVFARATVLCGLLCWGAISAWTRGRHWTAVLLTALALLAKEEAVALPVFFAALHLSISRNQREWRPIGAMFALALATGLRGLLATAQAGSGAGLDVATTPAHYAVTQGFVILRYLRLLTLPAGFNFDPDFRVAGWEGCAGWIVLLAALGFLLKARPRAGFWFAAGLIFLAPTSSLLPIDDLAADRRMYLAGACFAAALALLLPGLKQAHILLAGLLWAALSFGRSATFADPPALWRQALAGSPAKLRPRLQLSRAVPPAEALTLLADAGPDPRAASERGRVYLELGRPAEALREFGVALAAAPGDPRALTNRGTALAALNQPAAAQQDFLRAIAREPCFFPALSNLRRMGAPLPGLAACRLSPAQRSALGLR